MAKQVSARLKAACLTAVMVSLPFVLDGSRCASAQTLSPNPTPQMYVDNNKGGSEVVAAGKLAYEGQNLNCRQYPTVLDPLLNDYAAAPYKGFIVLNPRLISRVSQPVRMWIYHHECAHLLGMASEDKADCYATRLGRTSGWLDSDGLEKLCRFISDGKADSAHASGPDRCKAIRVCYQQNGTGAGTKPARRQ